MQEAGQAVYLLAWRGGQLAGRCTVLAASKYETVRQLLGGFPELNALEAHPTGQGTGTALIACAEQTARASGAAMIGMAVEADNDGAWRLYQRLGYRDWGHGLVTDYWDETAPDGTIRKTRADACRYLTKPVP
jgi:GNAT superfamily N-acetyltransferase